LNGNLPIYVFIQLFLISLDVLLQKWVAKRTGEGLTIWQFIKSFPIRLLHSALGFQHSHPRTPLALGFCRASLRARISRWHHRSTAGRQVLVC